MLCPSVRAVMALCDAQRAVMGVLKGLAGVCVIPVLICCGGAFSWLGKFIFPSGCTVERLRGEGQGQEQLFVLPPFVLEQSPGIFSFGALSLLNSGSVTVHLVG